MNVSEQTLREPGARVTKVPAPPPEKGRSALIEWAWGDVIFTLANTYAGERPLWLLAKDRARLLFALSRLEERNS